MSSEQFRDLTRPWKFFMAVVVVALVFEGGLRAQVTASVTGTVRDSSGAVMPGATVTVKNLESGLTRTVETGASGSYSVPSLPIGRYEVDVEKTGFKQE